MKRSIFVPKNFAICRLCHAHVKKCTRPSRFSILQAKKSWGGGGGGGGGGGLGTSH